MQTRAPQQARSVASTKRMLDTAMKILSQEGMEGLTVEKVVAQSKTSMGAFYLRFESRTGLIDALHIRFLQTIPPQLTKLIVTKTPKRDLYAELFDIGYAFLAFAELHKDEIALFVLQASKEGAFHEDAREVHRKIHEIFSHRISYHSGEISAQVLKAKIDFTYRLYYGFVLQILTWESDFITGTKKSVKNIAGELALIAERYLRTQ